MGYHEIKINQDLWLDILKGKIESLEVRNPEYKKGEVVCFIPPTQTICDRFFEITQVCLINNGCKIWFVEVM